MQTFVPVQSCPLPFFRDYAALYRLKRGLIKAVLNNFSCFIQLDSLPLCFFDMFCVVQYKLNCL